MTPVADNPLRKAAVFVRSLAPDAAAAMLGRLSADEARSLRTAIADLDKAGDDAEADWPALESPTRRQSSDDGTVELRLSGEPMIRTEPSPPTSSAMDGAQWLGSLHDADPRAIAEYLSKEHPRAVAAVLGYLPAELGAGVLQCLTADERRRVVGQLAAQGDADADSLRVIASGLAEWIRRKHEEHQRRSTRLGTIRQIVAATPEHARRDLLAGLAESEPEIASSLAELLAPMAVAPPAPALATEPTPPPAPAQTVSSAAPLIAFDDLERVDGRALAEAVATLDGRTALLALAAASEALVDRLASGLPRDVARDLRTRLHRVGPTTLTEIDRAQTALAHAVVAVVQRRRTTRLAADGRA